MKEGVVLQQLADVLPPPAPGMAWWLPLAMVVMALLAGSLIWLLRKRRSVGGNPAAREARQRLQALRHAWHSQTVSDREAAYRLATLLRLGLGLPQLAAPSPPAAVEDKAAWDETLAALHVLRYRDQMNMSLSPLCFDRAEQWLTAAQREAH